MTNLLKKTLHLPLSQRANGRLSLPKVAFLAFALFGLVVLSAQASQNVPPLAPRITSAIDNSSRVTLAGSHPVRAQAANDVGALPASTKLQGMTLVFSRSAAQQKALDALVAAQQDRNSPQYHQWLTPELYAARFGTASADIAAVENWLQQQGFTVESVARSRNSIRFSGSAAQVEAAFGAALHNFKASGNTETHFAPATDLTIPAALSTSVMAIRNVSSFQPRAHVLKSRGQMQRRFTSSESGDHYIDSKDLQTIYDVTAAYSAGYTGAGQTIAIVGQSAISTTDVTNYQTTLGYSANAPTITLEPGTGTSYTDADGDEAESDLDLEYASTMAPGATINFVYTGNNPNYGAFDALVYAVDQDLAPIISSSYGDCETDIGQAEYTTLNATLEQAAAQGQTVLAAAGDDGSTDCYEDTNLTPTQREALAVDFPGSSQYAISVGGSEFPASDVASTNSTYFAASSGTDVIGSALSYIPEDAWNDDSSSGGLAAGGGGASIFTAQPSWQAGVQGIATGSYRLVPDVSLDASPAEATLLFCTSDESFWNTAANGGTAPYQENSCNDGLRDSVSGDLTGGGGTSFAAPSFAGMLAVINQARGYTTGQGVANTTIYSLASNSTTYASAFHDITGGGNQCDAGVDDCSTAGAGSFAAGTGYDEATGLGSVDLYQLLTAWPGTSTASSSSFSLSATAVSATPGTNATSTVTVTPANGFTGTVDFTVYGPAALTYACYSLPDATISGTAAASSTLTLSTDASTCASGMTNLAKKPSTVIARNRAPQAPARKTPAVPLASVLAGVVLAGLTLKRRTRHSLGRLARAGLSLAALAALGLGASGLSGCSSNAASTVSTGGTGTTSTSTSNATPAGTYTITVTGVSSTNSSLVSSTTFTLTVS